MATIKGDPRAQLAYLERKDAALRAKVAEKLPDAVGKIAKARMEKRRRNVRLASEIVSARLATARKNAAERGITVPKPAKAGQGDK